MGRSKGGLTTKIHAVVDADGRLIKLDLTAGQVHDCKPALDLLATLEGLVAGRGEELYRFQFEVTVLSQG